MDKGGPINIELQKGKKLYFASDQHFGAPNYEESKNREHIFLRWLNEVKKDAQALFLLGDLFDFWHEYNTVVPKGFIRVLGKLAEFNDEGIPIYFFVGNHDLWMNDYLKNEIGFIIFRNEQEFIVHVKDSAENSVKDSVKGSVENTEKIFNFLLAHGDGLGPGDKGYKRMKKVFTNPISRFLFKWIHPDWGVALADYLSKRNRLISGEEDINFLGEDKEWLIIYSKEKLKEKFYNYFIYGHRHLPISIELTENSKYINLGDWINYYTFLVFDGHNDQLIHYK